MTSRSHHRFVAVDGAGQPTPIGRRLSRCESEHEGRRCAYVVGHDGYHCDKNGLQTWPALAVRAPEGHQG